MQLGLFLHSADVGLRNAVIAALWLRDTGAMRGAIDQLRADLPGDDSLAGFEQLFADLSALSGLTPSPAAIAGQLECTETNLLPILQTAIGADAAQRLGNRHVGIARWR